jgi:hypothetical protein
MEPYLADKPEFQQFIKDANKRIEDEARSHVLNAIATIVSSSDILVLSTMGIDAKQKILEVFIMECNKLKEEFSNEL